MTTTKGKERKKASPKKTGAKPLKKESVITKQDALKIAQAYLADKGGAFGISGIRDRLDESLEPFSAAAGSLTGALKDCWIVECSLDPFLVIDGGTMVIGISKTTGDILFASILHVA